MKIDQHALAVSVIFSIFTIFGFVQFADAALVTQLGILVDESGSIGTSNFAILRDGICNSLSSQLPIDGSVEITLMKFGTGTTLVFGPTIIDTITTKTNLLTACTNMVLTSGQSTCMSCGLNAITALIIPVPPSPENTVLINILTDGEPNSPIQTNLARNNAIAGGIDGLSSIAIDTGTPDPTISNFLANLAFPNPTPPAPVISLPDLLPNPRTQGFVVLVNSFSDVDVAFGAKLGVEIEQVIGGFILPIDPASLLVAGIFSNTLSIIGILCIIGVISFGVLYSRGRENKLFL